MHKIIWVWWFHYHLRVKLLSPLFYCNSCWFWWCFSLSLWIWYCFNYPLIVIIWVSYANDYRLFYSHFLCVHFFSKFKRNGIFVIFCHPVCIVLRLLFSSLCLRCSNRCAKALLIRRMHLKIWEKTCFVTCF